MKGLESRLRDLETKAGIGGGIEAMSDAELEAAIARAYAACSPADREEIDRYIGRPGEIIKLDELERRIAAMERDCRQRR